MTSASTEISSLGILDSLSVSLLGMSIVFFVLIALFVLIRVLRTVMDKIEVPEAAASPVAIPAETPAQTTADTVSSAFSKGEVKLHEVPDETSAMLMAIVADKTLVPLNELRFRSIREISPGGSGKIEINKKYHFKIEEELSDIMKYKITLNNKVYELEAERGEAILTNISNPATANVPTVTPAAIPAAVPAAGTVAGKTVKSPMPGTVLSISVNVGDMVKAGQIMLILEAMKMENEIVAPEDGKIVQIHVTRGASVGTGAPMITLA